MTPGLIEVKELSVSFGSNSVLEGVSFSVARGETIAILGKNGTGKSVTLKAIAGLIDYFSGSITIDGRAISDYYTTAAKPDGRGAGLAYVFQKGGLFDSMNLFDNTAFGLRRMGYNEEEVREIVSDAIYRVGLRGSENKLPSELSGGMQKRAGLARAICMNPEIILYDDPTAGLDPVLSDAISDLIMDIRGSSGTTSIIVTHDLTVVEKLADRVALLHRGRFVYTDTTENFLSKKNPYARQFIAGDIEGPIEAL